MDLQCRHGSHVDWRTIYIANVVKDLEALVGCHLSLRINVGDYTASLSGKSCLRYFLQKQKVQIAHRDMVVLAAADDDAHWLLFHLQLNEYLFVRLDLGCGGFLWLFLLFLGLCELSG